MIEIKNRGLIMRIKSTIILFFIALFPCAVLYAGNNAAESFRDEVKALVKDGVANADPNALIEAAKNDDINLVKSLVKNKEINIDKTDDDGYTALMYAVKNRDEYMVNILLSNEADPNVHARRGPSALSVAASQCRPSAEYNEEVGVISLLLRNGATRDKNNAACTAAINGCLSVATFLFENDAKIRDRFENPVVVQTVKAIPLVEYPFMKRNEELYAQIIELLVKNKS